MRTLPTIVLAFVPLLAGCERRDSGGKQGHPIPAPPETFEDLTTRAIAYLRARQTALQEDFGLGRYQHYDFNQDSAQLLFSEDGVLRVIAEVQVVGSYAPAAGTWRWAWANESVLDQASRNLEEVRSHGEAHRFERLAEPEWQATEEEAWEMTCLAALLLEAKGAYRAPGPRNQVFMIITDIRFASPEESSRPDQARGRAGHATPAPAPPQ